MTDMTDMTDMNDTNDRNDMTDMNAGIAYRADMTAMTDSVFIRMHDENNQSATHHTQPHKDTALSAAPGNIHLW